MPSTNFYKRQLEILAEELQARINKINQGLNRKGNPISPSFSEQVTERENSDVLNGLLEEGRFELRQVHSALSRIENGSYGQCMECQSVVSEARLNSLPYTPFCKNCAQALAKSVVMS